jgi:hypothetical protein
MIHPDTELRLVSPEIGYGVFASRRIPEGTIVWVLDELDMVGTPELSSQLPEAYRPILERYVFIDGKGREILCWDFGRYINHSCDPTCISIGAICDVAARDILPGEELSYDYSLLNSIEQFECRCGLPQCRGKVTALEAPQITAAMDRQVLALLPLVSKLEQPLIPFMRADDRVRALDIVAGRLPLPSAMDNLGPRQREALAAHR